MWCAKNCSRIFSLSTAFSTDRERFGLAITLSNKFVGYCNVDADFGTNFASTDSVAVILALIDIQERKVVTTITELFKGDRKIRDYGRSNSFIGNVELKFVEEHFVVRYRLKFKPSFEYKAFKLVSTTGDRTSAFDSNAGKRNNISSYRRMLRKRFTGNKVSLKLVKCIPHWNSAFKSQEDKIYALGRCVYARNGSTPDSVLATLPYITSPITYYNEETGTFITGMGNDEILSLNVHK